MNAHTRFNNVYDNDLQIKVYLAAIIMSNFYSTIIKRHEVWF